jgi:hypothetical protein
MGAAVGFLMGFAAIGLAVAVGRVLLRSPRSSSTTSDGGDMEAVSSTTRTSDGGDMEAVKVADGV